MLQDLRHALRLVHRQPIVTAVAALTLALGIGANSAVFTLSRGVFASPLPIDDVDTVVAVFGTVEDAAAGGGADYFPVSWPNYEDMRRQTGALDDMAASTFVGVTLESARPQSDPVPLVGLLVSANYFEVLGVEATTGLTFLAEEGDPPGAHPVAVVSYTTWQEELGGDPDVVGRDVRLNGHPFTIVGVAREGFDGPFALFDVDLFAPIAMHPQLFAYSEFVEARRWRMFQLYGRLAEGFDAPAAEADLRTIASRLTDEYPDDNHGRLVRVLPLAEAAIDPNQRPQFVRTSGMLSGVVGLVLLIACANVANLMLARAGARSREIALRLSLGARRARVARQLVTESVVLAALGGVLAVPVGSLVRDLLWRYRPAQLPEGLDVGIDLGVLAFTFGLTLLTGVLFGLAPAARIARTDLARGLQERAPSDSGGASLRGALVVAQVALAFVAVIGAGLFLSSLREIGRVHPGFELDRLLVGGVAPGSLGYSEDDGQQLYRSLVERLTAEAGVAAVAVASNPPLSPTIISRTTLREGAAEDTAVLIGSNSVTPGYFDTLGLPILRGRGFSADDAAASRPVLIASSTMAEQLWPGEDPIGRRVRFLGETELYEVVGVVTDVKYTELTEDPRPYFYVPMAQRYAANATLLVRSERPTGVIDRIRGAAGRVEPGLRLADLAPAATLADQALQAPRAAAVLLSSFATLALGLAAVGIYGVLAQLVVQRRREIGVRMAMGADRGDVLRLVGGQSLKWVLAGGGIGLGLALIGSRWVASMLYHVQGHDPRTYVSTAVVLVLAAMASAAIPARRASRVDPVEALRDE